MGPVGPVADYGPMAASADASTIYTVAGLSLFQLDRNGIPIRTNELPAAIGTVWQ
jgi:hypothetical protein